MPDDDEAARKAARGRSEHASYPGIPTWHLKQMVMGPPKPPPPLAPTVPPPPPAPGLDSTPAEPIRVRAREREQTRVGIGAPPLPPVQARPRRATETGLAPPAPQSAPQPPTLPSLPPSVPGSQASAQEPPRSITPPGSRLVANHIDPPELTERTREELKRRGDHLDDAPASTTYSPAAPEPPPWLTAKGLGAAAALVTATAGLVAALSAGVVQVIKAIREPSEGAKVKDIADAKKAGEECQAAVASERKATLAREEALAERITTAEGKTSELARRVPEVKPDPSRPPKP